MPDVRYSLRHQLLWQLGPVMLLLFCLGGYGAYRLAREYSSHVYDSWLYDSAQSLCVLVRRGDAGVIVDLPESLQKSFLWDESDTTYFEVTGERAGRAAGNAEIPPPAADAERYGNGVIFDAAIHGEPVRVVSLQLQAETRGETIRVEVAETKHKRHALQRDLLVQILGVQTVLLAAASMVIWRGVSRALQPLKDIVRQLERHDQPGVNPVPDSAVPVEVRPLARALNDVVARLDSSLLAQRRFVADAAHQLRTPLTGLLLHLDDAQHESDPHRLREILSRLRLSAERAVRLSNQLLALSRAEPEAVALQAFGPFELCALARDVGADWVPAALKKDIDLSFQSDRDHVDVLGNPLLLREAINNLIDNAIKYHPGNGSIILSVAGAPRPQLTIDDDGPGIPEAERGQVTRRFYRSEVSHGGGAGLGLAIVKEIAQAHSAELRIESGASGRGTRVRITFPASSTKPKAN